MKISHDIENIFDEKYGKKLDGYQGGKNKRTLFKKKNSFISYANTFVKNEHPNLVYVESYTLLFLNCKRKRWKSNIFPFKHFNSIKYVSL